MKVRLLIPASATGILIGRGGENIKNLVESCGVSVEIMRKNEMVRGVDERIMTCVGLLANCLQTIRSVLEQHQQTSTTATAAPSTSSNSNSNKNSSSKHNSNSNNDNNNNSSHHCWRIWSLLLQRSIIWTTYFLIKKQLMNTTTLVSTL